MGDTRKGISVRKLERIFRIGKKPKGGVRNIIAGKGDYSGNPLKIEEL